jgi:hypothetical protein
MGVVGLKRSGQQRRATFDDVRHFDQRASLCRHQALLTQSPIDNHHYIDEYQRIDGCQS